MARRTALQYYNLSDRFRFKSRYARPLLSLSLTYLYITCPLFTVWCTYISISIKIVSAVAATVGSFDTQNRCKFVERFFLRVRAWSRSAALLLQWWSIKFSTGAHKRRSVKKKNKIKTSNNIDFSNTVCLAISTEIGLLRYFRYWGNYIQNITPRKQFNVPSCFSHTVDVFGTNVGNQLISSTDIAQIATQTSCE